LEAGFFFKSYRDREVIEMIIDALGGPAPPPAVDMRSVRKPERVEPRAVEDSDKSDSSKLDRNKEEIDNERTSSRYRIKDNNIELRIYNAKGVLIRKIPPGYVTTYEQGPINLTA
jgi:hypothetical protein